VHALSFEQAPPPSAPLRFFLTAPLFLFLGGGLLMADGGQALVSRWTPSALALTHLLTVGFMLQVMLGALFQLMPVAVGANLWQPARLAAIIHGLSVVGALLLVAGFRFSLDGALLGGGVLLAATLLAFSLIALRALWRTPAHGATVIALRWAVAALALTVLLGLAMAAARSGHGALAVLGWSSLHVGLGLAGWGGGLVAATAYLAVPMFQLTPAYPAGFTRHFAPAVALALAGAAALDHALAWLPLLGLMSAFALLTLDRQRRRRRAKADVSLRLWQLAMGCVIAGVTVCTAHIAGALPATGAQAAGVLLLWGGFVSLIVGMLYKIMPFILWLYLEPRLANVPPMTRMLSEPLIRWHLRAHVATLAASLAVLYLPALEPLAGLLMAVAALLLAAQLLRLAHKARRALARGAQAS
jgi:hypothetical protein